MFKKPNSTAKNTTEIVQKLCIFACNVDASDDARLREIANAIRVLNMLRNVEKPLNRETLWSVYENASKAAQKADGSCNISLLNYAVSLKAGLEILNRGDTKKGREVKDQLLEKMLDAINVLKGYKTELAAKMKNPQRPSKVFHNYRNRK